MITAESRLINQLLGVVYRDKKDPTIIRVGIDNAIRILYEYGILVPVKLYEEHLQILLNKHLVGKARVENSTVYNIAKIMYDLAKQIAIDEDEIIKYMSENQSQENAVQIQQKIDEWRKEYYGSMKTDEREALVEALHDRLRPEILEKIRNPK